MLNKIGYQITSCVDEMVVEEFDYCLHLMDYLSKTGMSTPGLNNRGTMMRDVFLGVNAMYDLLYSKTDEKEEKDGRKFVPATFDIIQYIGWKYHHAREQPIERGSGMSFRDFIKEVADEGENQESKRYRFGTIDEEGQDDVYK